MSKMMRKSFNTGDLVWAKMKGFCFWPAKITDPPKDSPASNLKKAQHYVVFFGSENYAWIADELIVHHTEEEVAKAKKKKLSSVLKRAIDAIVKESGLKSGARVEPVVPKEKVKEKSKTEPEPQSEEESDDNGILVNKMTAIESSKVEKRKKQARPPKSVKRKISAAAASATKRQKTFNKSSLGSYKSEAGPSSKIAVIKPYDDFLGQSDMRPVKDESIESKTMNETIVGRNLTATDKKIGFLGLGELGERIIKNFLNTGHKVTVWDESNERCLKYTNIGAQVANSPADIVRCCDVIFACVPGPDASKDLLFRKCGVLEGLDQYHKEKKGYVEMSTLDPETSKKISDLIEGKNCRYLEAPVSGSRKSCEDGSLIIVAAGDPKLFNECESCFYAISKHAFFLGPEVKQATNMNIALNMLISTTYAIVAETMALADKLRLPTDILIHLLKILPGKTDKIFEKAYAMADRDFTVVDTLKHQLTSLIIAQAVAETVNQPTPVMSATVDLYKHASLLNYGDLDVSAVIMGVKY